MDPNIVGSAHLPPRPSVGAGGRHRLRARRVDGIDKGLQGLQPREGTLGGVNGACQDGQWSLRVKVSRHHGADRAGTRASRSEVVPLHVVALETGHRRPSLELLLPLAEAYRVPLDDLVGAPEVGDPRLRFKPRHTNGRTVVPLTRQPGGIQGWKIIPTSKRIPELKSHEGREWLYVLSGRTSRRCARSAA